MIFTRATILQALCMPVVFDDSIKRSRWMLEAYPKSLAGVLNIELLGGEKLEKRAVYNLDGI